MRRLIIFLIMTAIFTPSLLRAEEELSLTLDEAIAIALRDNRDILLKSEDVKKAKEKIAEAKAGLLPTLNFTGTWSETRGYYADDLAQTTTQTTLKQYLYKGGKIINTIKYNGYNFEVTEALLDKAKLEAIYNVQNGFYTLMLADEYAKVNKGILENTKEHLAVIQARFTSGQASESDILQIKQSLDSVEEAYVSSINQVEAAQIILRTLLYLKDDVLINAQGQFTYESMELIYDEAFLEAMRKRPEIRQYEAQEKANKVAVEIAKADSRPNIYASWDYYGRSHTTATASRNWNDYNVIGFTFSWPIFDGLVTKHKVEQAIVDLKESQLLKEKAIKDIAAELKGAYLDFKNAVAKIKSTQSDIEVYQDVLSTAKEKYKAGIISFLDLNDAHLAYQISWFNQKDAIYDYILAKERYQKAKGG